MTWHAVAPLLARSHPVVCPDLRGYGGSSKPTPAPDHEPHSKRAMARDGVALMRSLGYERFAVVGHDRGSYVAFRLALDHPDAVSHLVVMDSVPIWEALTRCDARFAHDWWHWWFLGNTAARAPEVISRDPDWWYKTETLRDAMPEAAWVDLRDALRDPKTVRAMCEDYRAGLTVDRANDQADRAAGRRVAAPTHVLWSTRDDMERLYGDVLAIWRSWADVVSGAPVTSGHHAAEEAPDVVADEIIRFVKG
jgi:haloacetate dehalogenase